MFSFMLQSNSISCFFEVLGLMYWTHQHIHTRTAYMEENAMQTGLSCADTLLVTGVLTVHYQSH